MKSGYSMIEKNTGFGQKKNTALSHDKAVSSSNNSKNETCVYEKHVI